MPCQHFITFAETGPGSSFPGWRRSAFSFIVKVRVVVHEVEVDTRLDNSFGLFPDGRAVAVALDTRRRVRAFVEFIVARVAPAERQSSALGRPCEETKGL